MTENVVTPPENETKKETSAADENKPQGQGVGAFSLKPAGRKKPVNWKIVGVIIGGIVIVLLFTIIFAAIVINNRADPEPEIDETGIKAEVVTRSIGVIDDPMGAFMEAHLPQDRDKTESDSRTVQSSGKQESNGPVSDKKNTQTSGGQSTVNPVTPVTDIRVPETLFSPVARFDSSGISQGVGGSSDGVTSSSGYDVSAEEGRLREFANADPAEIVNRALQSQADTVNGGISSDMRSNILGDLSSSRQYATAKAYKSPPRKYLLKRRTNFQCVLYTAVKTDHSGFVGCRLTKPIFSADGSVILAEAGAELNGEQKIEVKQGQSTVFTSWSELETTAGTEGGIRADLNGLGTGPMGSSGTDAYIDNHYGQRFGGAVMLSFIQDAIATAANAAQKNKSTYSFDNSEDNAESMAEKALENSINIPPTGYVLPGTVINVIVAQDIDFSSVYTVKY
ncbi:TPA: TrbI/VirB10 family protein [Escherichia coli]